MTMEADIFFSRLQGVVVPLGTFLAVSQPQVKPEIGMAPMRRKQVASRRAEGTAAAAQHVLPAMQHYMIPQCTNCLEL
ncbi:MULTISPECIES: hypothetical protein [unclassified Mesorhizobium]|uniref:hypothetical protein n=1 Tax=unclassified Mesorhizobium TaxID=325217 RepID=UPI00112616FB|nr:MULTISPECIES: hypothetical protein [unclassified Mesorhizobium]MBZ9742438.1 hypothetical protein [Mesorhizobium sp. CO1-1-4]MBZ9802353.1 hypothetical protein [Mesorhizobium sp. ES1-6]MBZ9997693.1 hypothetical protein [Mesorhizobium sp. BH1-1-4]TPL93307.1 hypothetical protein FJ948_05310 [Mesorhizobium sp. B2-3-12]